MKKYLMSGALALIAGLFVTSCHDDDVYVNSDVIDQKVQNFRKAFKESFGSINPNQTWGFKQSTTSATTGMANNANMNVSGYNPNWGFDTATRTRAVDTWSNYHVTNDTWMSNLNFEKPADAITVTDGMKFDSNKSYYIPTGFTGTFYTNNSNWVKLYVAGEVTQSQYGDDNANDLNIYILKGGTWKCKFQGSNRVTIYNNGTLDLPSDALQSTNLGCIYNGGTFVLGDGTQNINIGDGNVNTRIYSNGTGNVQIKGKSITFGCGADIHGTMKVTGNIDELQTDKERYVCDLEVSGRLYLNKGALYTSYVTANEIEFNCFPLYLLPGGHVKTNKITMPNSGIYVKGYSGSNGLVEVGDIIFQNDNDFDRTFSSNIFFKVTGFIDCKNVTNGSLKEKDKFDNAEKYIAANGNLNDNRLNGGNATGYPECGPEPSWKVGDSGTTPDPETPNNPNPGNPGHEDNTETVVDGDTTTTIDSTFFFRRTYDEVGRIFCEDLGVNYSNRDDFDYNDAVFDVTIMTRTEHCKVTTTTVTLNYEITVDTIFFDDGTYECTENIIEKEPTIDIDSVFVDIDGPRYFAKIYLYAAGGTIPLTVAGVEVHEAFGVGHTTMVNTRDEHTDAHYTVNGANTVSRNPVILENPNGIAESEGGEGKEWFEFGRDIEYYRDGMPNANDVPVVVYFGDVNVVKELEAIQGDAPQKIKVGLNTLWASERCYFGDAYPKFTDYVGNGSTDWQNYGDPDYLYNETASISTEAEGTTETTISKSGSVTEHVLYNNPSGYDISRGLYFTDRNLLTVKLDIQVGDKLRFYADVESDDWCIFLADGNSNRLHADQTSLNNHDYAEVTLTADLVSKLRSNNTNAAMVIAGYGVSLTKVSLIKK